MRNPDLEKATRRLGSKQAIGERIIGMNDSQAMSHSLKGWTTYDCNNFYNKDQICNESNDMD